MRAFGSLRRRADFARLYRRGKLARGRHLSLYALRDRGPGERPLVGIAVAKAVGNAVERNRLRRRAKAVFERFDWTGKAAWRFVLVAKPGSAAVSFAEFAGDLQAAYERACGAA